MFFCISHHNRRCDGVLKSQSLLALRLKGTFYMWALFVFVLQYYTLQHADVMMEIEKLSKLRFDTYFDVSVRRRYYRQRNTNTLLYTLLLIILCVLSSSILLLKQRMNISQMFHFWLNFSTHNHELWVLLQDYNFVSTYVNCAAWLRYYRIISTQTTKCTYSQQCTWKSAFKTSLMFSFYKLLRRIWENSFGFSNRAEDTSHLAEY